MRVTQRWAYTKAPVPGGKAQGLPQSACQSARGSRGSPGSCPSPGSHNADSSYTASAPSPNLTILLRPEWSLAWPFPPTVSAHPDCHPGAGTAEPAGGQGPQHKASASPLPVAGPAGGYWAP